MSLAGWTVRQIERSVAQAIVVERHYLHRKAPCSAAFGLFSPADTLTGVVLYGTPSSAPLRRGICGPEFANDVCELTRLWIEDAVPKNGESFLIGNTVRRAGKPIVVSFADTEQGHVGTIYQATNWLYTGLSAKRTSWAVEGEERHGQTWADKMSAQEIREKFGDRFSLKERSRKHRYLFIAAKGRKRREILAALRYPLLPYPQKFDPNQF
jgi:hypothetical protein